MNRFTHTVAALLAALALLALPSLASATPPSAQGVLGAIDAGQGTALERVLARDTTLGVRIAHAYHTPRSDGAAATIERSMVSSAELWRVMRAAPTTSVVAAR